MRRQTILRTVLNLSTSSSAHLDIFTLLILAVMLAVTSAQSKTSLNLGYIPNDLSHEDPKRGETRALLSRYGRSPAVLSRYGKRSMAPLRETNSNVDAVLGTYFMPSRQLEKNLLSKSPNDFSTTATNQNLFLCRRAMFGEVLLKCIPHNSDSVSSSNSF